MISSEFTVSDGAESTDGLGLSRLLLENTCHRLRRYDCCFQLISEMPKNMHGKADRLGLIE